MPILVTRLCRNFLPAETFAAYDRVFISPERITSAYNSYLHALWTPTDLGEDVPAESSLEDQMEEEDDPEFWQQPPPSNSTAFMSSIWKGMKKILKARFHSGVKWMNNIPAWHVLRRRFGVHARLAPALRPTRVGGDGDIISSPYLLHLHLHDIH